MENLDLAKAWKGKKVAFIGDSITDAIHVGTTKNYWEFLGEFLGIDYHVYGVNGMQWPGVPDQARKIRDEMGDSVDAIFILMGTNDYNACCPLGDWWQVDYQMANVDGNQTLLAHRTLNMTDNTFCGRVNRGMQVIRELFVRQQIVLMTPIHRSFACFSPDNVQQDEAFANASGLYIEQYVEKLREAADIWSTSLIDLFRDANLCPSIPQHARFFHDAETDRLHPNADGHRRMALAMAYKMLTIPPCFE